VKTSWQITPEAGQSAPAIPSALAVATIKTREIEAVAAELLKERSGEKTQ